MNDDFIDVQVERDVFNEIYLPLLDDTARTQIAFGGASSGKSVFLAQHCIYDLMRGGRNYLVCRAVGKTLKKSVFNEVKKVIGDWGVQGLFRINKSDLVITCANGYQIYFIGLDDVEKIKSITPEKGVFTDIWVEEATECGEKTIIQLYKRQRGGSKDTPKRLTLSFNPILQSHWIYKRYFSALAWADEQTEYRDEQLSILKTWHIHNRFLTQADHEDFENEKDPYYHKVYARGGWGILGNVIFKNWVITDLNDPNNKYFLPDNQRTNRRNGIDFGFSSDPAALFISHYDKKHKIIYIYDEFYEAGLTNDILAEETINHIGRDPVTCDSAEPKSIAELKQHGVNAKSAKKGKDSIVHGIQWFKQQTIVIDKSCINAKNEFQQYKWKEDKDGNAIRQPVDKMNHLIDAGRYAYEKDSTAGQKAKSKAMNFYAPRKKSMPVPAPAHSDLEIDRILKEVQQ